MSEQQWRVTADRTRLSRQERQRLWEVCRRCAQIFQFRNRLTRIPPTLESVIAGSTLSGRENAVQRPASSRPEIPKPVPDKWEQGLAPAVESILSDNGEYEGQSHVSQVSPECQERQQCQQCQESQVSQAENQ